MQTLYANLPYILTAISLIVMFIVLRAHGKLLRHTHQLEARLDPSVKACAGGAPNPPPEPIDVKIEVQFADLTVLNLDGIKDKIYGYVLGVDGRSIQIILEDQVRTLAGLSYIIVNDYRHSIKSHV